MRLMLKYSLKFANQYSWLLFLNVFLITALVGILTRMYFVFSRNGMWLDIDTSRMTQYILTVYESGNIHAGPMYANGFLYPIVASIHSMILGVDVFTYQFLIHPFFSLLLIFPSYALAKQVLNPYQNHNYSTLNILLYGYILLNCSSVLIFVTSRGSHGLFTYIFIILYLSLLFNSMISSMKKIFLIVVFFFAVTSSNVYFGTVLLSILFSYWIVKKITTKNSFIKLNFANIITINLVLLLLVIFIVYPASSTNYVNIMYLAFYKLKEFIEGSSNFSPIYPKYLSLWNSQIIYILLFQSDLAILGLSFMFVLYLLLRKRIQYLTSDIICVYFSLGLLITLTLLLDMLRIGFGSNFGFRVLELYLIVASLVLLQFFNIIIKHSRKYNKIIILILLIWLSISPITATIKATAPSFVSGYLNSYSQSTAYSIKWLNQKISSPSYISTVNEFQPKDYLENLITLFAFGKVLLSDKSNYIFLDHQILWHIKWLKQHGYSDRYELTVAFIKKVPKHNKIYDSGYSTFFSLSNTSIPS